jgi:hypothetical protein
VYQSANRLPVKKPTSDDAVSTSSMRPDHFEGVNTNPANGKTDFMALIVADRERPRQCIKQSDCLEKTRRQLTRA